MANLKLLWVTKTINIYKRVGVVPVEIVEQRAE